MGNVNYTRVVLGSLRYKSAPTTDLAFQVPFNSTQRELIEYDRVSDINLEQLFQDEREKSNFIRPSCKIQLIFKNTYTGTTRYLPFENNLFYTNAEEVVRDRCLTLNNQTLLPWGGYPLYNEFDFIRTDYAVSGYTIPSGNTIPPNVHVNFVPKSASSYNWNFFVSYPYDNDFTKELSATLKIPSDPPQYIPLTWTVGDGIPFVIEKSTFNGRNIIRFRCPVRHGMDIGNYVQLSTNFTYDNNRLYQVYTLGDNTFGSEEYVFNIIDYGYTGTTFNTGLIGTAKRVINVNNVTDSISQYYVRTHKILTNVEESVVVKTGFEENVFNTVKKYQSAPLTPNGVARTMIKEGSQTYSLTFNEKLDISNLLDNQRRPLTELFITVIWKGYFGWTFGRPQPPQPPPPPPGFYGLKQGWEFNLPLTQFGLPSNWWSDANTNSDTNFPLGVYNTGLLNNPSFQGFTYVESLKKDDEFDGDVCEWNNYEQRERVVSEIYHKIKFNDNVFNIISAQQLMQPFNQRGYYYRPLFSLPIRVFSDYIEDGNTNVIDDVPNWSYFSTNQNSFRWRDLYPFGFVDTSGLGYDFPFLNGVHYPYENYVFRIIPEGTNYVEQTIIQQPIIDNCE